MDFIIKVIVIIGLLRFVTGITMYFLGRLLDDNEGSGHHECASGLLTLTIGIVLFIINYIYSAGA